jgi:uncharacterized protein YegP (UPF0339 family)
MKISLHNQPPYSFAIAEKSGSPLFQSRSFDSLEESQQFAEGIKNGRPHRFERFTDTEGMFRFRLTNSTRVLIGQSIGYHSKAGMENAIKQLRDVFGV